MSEQIFSEAMRPAVEAAKAEGFDLEYIKVGGKEFAYRPVMRSEWKTLLRKRNEAILAAGDDEVQKASVMEEEFEELLKVCLVYSPVAIEKLPAGSVQVLVEAILAMSGFSGADISPVKL
jgi:hypothetical protein